MSKKPSVRDAVVTFRLSSDERAVFDQLRAALYEFDKARDIPSVSDVERWLLAHAREAFRRSPRQFIKEISKYRDN